MKEFLKISLVLKGNYSQAHELQADDQTYTADNERMGRELKGRSDGIGKMKVYGTTGIGLLVQIIKGV
jgi:hypothetical protein